MGSEVGGRIPGTERELGTLAIGADRLKFGSGAARSEVKGRTSGIHRVWLGTRSTGEEGRGAEIWVWWCRPEVNLRSPEDWPTSVFWGEGRQASGQGLNHRAEIWRRQCLR